MTRDQAIEACAKAIIKRYGFFAGQGWRAQYPNHIEFAENLVAALEALGIFKVG